MYDFREKSVDLKITDKYIDFIYNQYCVATPITIQSESAVRVYAINKTIEVKNSNASVISVYNLIGNKVYEGTNTSIPVGQNGIYIVKVGAKAYKTIVK